MFSLVFSFLQRPLFHYGNVQYREFSIFANVLEQSKRLLNLTPTGLVWNTNVAAVALFLAHQYGCHDVMWKRFIVRQIQNKIDVNEVLWARETKQPHKPLFSLKPLDTKPSWVDLTLSQPYSGSIQKRTTNPSPLAIWIFFQRVILWVLVKVGYFFQFCALLKWVLRRPTVLLEFFRGISQWFWLKIWAFGYVSVWPQLGNKPLLWLWKTE